MNQDRLDELMYLGLKPEEAVAFAALTLEADELFDLLRSLFPGLRIELPDGLGDLAEIAVLTDDFDDD
jgi:hypothetical protein